MIVNNSSSDAVSIILPIHNGQQFLLDALQSISRQTEENWECIVVDDHSHDHSLEIARQWMVRQPQRVQICALPGSRPIGVSRARNAALEKAKGRVVAFLDQDDYWHPEKLERQLAALTQSASGAVVACVPKLLIEAPAEIPGAVTLLRWYAEIRRLAQCRDHLHLHDHLCWSPVCVSSAIAYTEYVRFCGGFSHSTDGLADWLLWAKMDIIGASTELLSDQLVTYRIHGENHILSLLNTPSFLPQAARATVDQLVDWAVHQVGLTEDEASTVIESAYAPLTG